MLDVREEDGVVVVAMVHGKANTMDVEFCGALVELLARLDREGASAVVLTGQARIFSAGVDLLRLLDGGPDYVREFVPSLAAMARAVFEFPRPLVAAVNGHAIAGGCVLACAADRRLMADSGGRIGVPELRVGVPFPAVALEIMRAAVSPDRFRLLAYDGITVEAAEAKAWGVIDEVIPADRLLDQALRSARQLARVPADVFRLTKMQMRRPSLERMAASERADGAEVLRIWTAPGTFDEIRRYVESTFKRNA